MRANIEKAKAGSLAHTKWLYELVDKQRDAMAALVDGEPKTLAAILMDELAKKR